jgi:hypothetical protein
MTNRLSDATLYALADPVEVEGYDAPLQPFTAARARLDDFDVIRETARALKLPPLNAHQEDAIIEAVGPADGVDDDVRRVRIVRETLAEFGVDTDRCTAVYSKVYGRCKRIAMDVDRAHRGAFSEARV